MMQRTPARLAVSCAAALALAAAALTARTARADDDDEQDTLTPIRHLVVITGNP